ncbi:MAG: HlyD family type I secretion periplasmic adaptor subunit [Victivallaceae bacterium]
MAEDKNKNEVMLAKDAIEYQPDAIELASSQLPWWARMGVLWLFLFFVGIIIWASVSKVDVIVQCQGKVATKVNNISMQPPERMVIDEVCVREGDHVRAGDILFKFDPTINQADVRNYEEAISKLKPTYERLLAEFEDREYVPADPKDRNQRIQKTIFDQRKRTYDSKYEYYTSQIKSTESQLQSVKESLASTEKNIKIYENIVNIYRTLHEKKVATIVELSSVEMNLLNYQNQRDQYKNAIPNYQSQLASNIAERQAYVESWKEQVAEEFNDAEQKLTESTQQLEKVKRYSDYYELIAPREAIVQEVAKYARGSAVREAEPLISLIPVGDDLTYIIEIEIPAKDISKVKARDKAKNQPGDAVRIKLSAYPFQTWGTMEGELVQISEDIFNRNPQQTGMSATTMMQGTSYYRGEVEIKKYYKKMPPGFQMRPGMEAQAEVITGDRRIISYVFHPLIKMLDESVREP